MGKPKPDPMESVRDKMRQAAKDSGLTLEEIGVRMGLAKGGARQAVSRLLQPDSNYDPRLSTLLAFSAAVNRPLQQIL
jgi:transcriptional regulator with XRE-family HTH domain